jgi:TRAP-type C4-dicarboxylate transport system permease small subunit
MNILYRAVMAFTSVCLALMVIVISWQVFSRFLLNRTPFWSEEVALLLMIYFGFFGAVAAYRERLHIGIKVILESMPDTMHGGFLFVLDVVIGAFAVFMIVWGSQLVGAMMKQTLPALSIKVGYSYLPIPVSGFVLLLFVVEKRIMPDPLHQEQQWEH